MGRARARALPGGIARSLPLSETNPPPATSRRHYRIIYSSLSPLNHPVLLEGWRGDSGEAEKEQEEEVKAEEEEEEEEVEVEEEEEEEGRPPKLPLSLFNRRIIKIIPALGGARDGFSIKTLSRGANSYPLKGTVRREQNARAVP